MTTLRSDCAAALASLRRSLKSAMALAVLVAVATTAIGSAIWVQPLLERQLAPFPAVDRLVWLSKADATGDNRLTVAEFQLVQELDLFDDMAAFGDREQSVSIVGPSGPLRMSAATVDYKILRLLGAPAPRPSAADPGLVIGESAARTLFGVDAAVRGQQVRVDGADRTIAAVAPSWWQFPFPADVWLALDLAEPRVRASRAPFLRAIARLPVEGLTAVDATSALTTIGGARGGRIIAIPLTEVLTDPYRHHLSAIQIAAPLVAIAAVLNGGLLVLARGIRRQRASLTRLALGATYATAARPLSIEVGLIVAAGSLLGLLAVPTASALALGTMLEGTIGGATSLMLAATVGIVCASMTAIIAARWLRRTATAETWAGGDGGRVLAPHKTTQLLVIGQLAIALVVCFVATAASAHVRKFERLNLLPEGLDAVTVPVSLRQSQYPTAAAAAAFFGRLITELEQSPNIRQATYASRLPGLANPSIESLYVDNQLEPRVPQARVSLVGSGFFSVTGIQRIAGREFSLEELTNPRQRPAIVIDVVASTRLFGSGLPIGQRVSLGTASSTAYEVIGVVRNVREPELDPAAAPGVYLPAPAVASGYLLIQTGNQDVTGTVREALRQIDPEQAVGQAVTLRHAVADATSPMRARAQLLWFLVVACAVIVNLGVAALVGSSIAAREREFGVRMVLGRSRRALVGDTVASLARQAALAALLAFAMGGALWPAVSSALPGTTAWDTAAISGTGGLIVLVVLGTGWLAASISLLNNPADLLRR